MNDSKKTIIGKILVTAIGSGASQIINFIFGIILVRILDELQYSVYKQGNLILALSMSFFFVISPLALSYFIGKSKSKEEEKAYLFNTVISLMITSFIGIFVLYLCKDFICHQFSNSLLLKYFDNFLILIFLETSVSYYTYYMVAINKIKKMSIMTLIFSVLRVFGLLLAIILANDYNFFDLFFIFYIIAIFIKFIVILYDTIKNNKDTKLHLSYKLVKKQIAFSMPIMGMSIITTLNANIDKLFVALLYDNPILYSIYTNGAYEIPFVSLINTSVISVMLPNISKKFNETNKKENKNIVITFKSIINCCLLIMIPLTFSIFVFSKNIVIFLFSEKYIESSLLFSIYIFMLVFKALNLSVLITAANKQRYLLKDGVIMIVTNIVLILMIKNSFLGFNYLTLAPVLSTLLLNIMMYFDIKKIYGFDKLDELIPFKELISYSLLCLIISYFVLVLSNLVNLSNKFETIIFCPISYFLCFISCLVIFKENKNILKILMRRS